MMMIMMMMIIIIIIAHDFCYCHHYNYLVIIITKQQNKLHCVLPDERKYGTMMHQIGVEAHHKEAVQSVTVCTKHLSRKNKKPRFS